MPLRKLVTMTRFWGFLLMAVLGTASMPTAWTHPAHAEELNWPFVPGFERFFSNLDPDDYLLAGGYLLLDELNCVACHDAPKDRFPGVEGPQLSSVGSRYQSTPQLQLMIRNPRVLKRATRMPSLFAGPGRDPDELDAIFHFLVSLKDETEHPPQFLGIAEDGQGLYHEIGCVACHAPDAEYRPLHLPENFKLEEPALPSHSLRIAEFWTTDFLTRYLQNPLATHPSGQMPNFSLSEQEAADLAAYLQAAPGEAEKPIPLPEVDPVLAAKGRELFDAKRCSACHDVGSGLKSGGVQVLSEVRAELIGCLADEPQPNGVPFFFLGPTQRRALKLALEDLANGGEGPQKTLGTSLMRENCYACHTLDGRGGPEEAREPYFGVTSLYAPDREDFWPPALDGVGEEMSREELLSLFSGKRESRYPKVKARMLVLPRADAERWSALLGVD